jgi:hypothetical protein
VETSALSKAQLQFQDQNDATISQVLMSTLACQMCSAPGSHQSDLEDLNDLHNLFAVDISQLDLATLSLCHLVARPNVPQDLQKKILELFGEPTVNIDEVRRLWAAVDPTTNPEDEKFHRLRWFNRKTIVKKMNVVRIENCKVFACLYVFVASLSHTCFTCSQTQA